MALFSREFIAVPDARKGQILFKWPDHSIRRFSQLIVEPDQMAVFISRGEVVGTLPPGKHQVDAREIPGLGAFADAATGGNAYRTELFFVGTREYVGQRFGGRIDDVQDPASKILVGLRVFGDYSVHVDDPVQLILQLTGTVDVADNEAVTGWMAEQLLKGMRQFVTTQVVRANWPVVSLSAYMPEIEAGSVTAANAALASYGLSIRRLGNFDISLMEEDAQRLKDLTKDVKYSELAGGYMQMSQAEMMRGAGAGMAEGGGQAPLVMAGMGLGQSMMQPQSPQPVPQQPQMVPAGAAATPCSSCGAALAPGAKFCPQCGTAQAVPAQCSHCNAPLAPGAKFCPECGTAQAAAVPTKCKNCNAELAPGAKFCPECGEKQGE